MSDAPPVMDPPANGAPPTTPTPPPESATPKHWVADWIKSDQTLDHKALDRLPEHLKPLKETLGRQKTVEDVFTVMQNQQFLNGKKGLAPLPADAPDNVKAERKQLLDQINGVPPKPTDYKIERPQDIPEGAWNPKLVEGYSTWAHKHSVSPAAAAELVQTQLGAIKEQIEGQKQYEVQYWQKEAQTFEDLARQQNIPMDRANSLVEKGAIALGLDLSNEQTKTFLKGANARQMAMAHALAVGEDTIIQGDSKQAEADPGAQAQDIARNASNPLYAQYWNKDGKFSRSQQESAQNRYFELLRLDAERRSGKGRNR